MKPFQIFAIICILLAVILFEIVLYGNGQNQYPGALTSVTVMLGAVLVTITHQRTED